MSMLRRFYCSAAAVAQPAAEPVEPLAQHFDFAAGFFSLICYQVPGAVPPGLAAVFSGAFDFCRSSVGYLPASGLQVYKGSFCCV